MWVLSYSVASGRNVPGIHSEQRLWYIIFETLFLLIQYFLNNLSKQIPHAVIKRRILIKSVKGYTHNSHCYNIWHAYSEPLHRYSRCKSQAHNQYAAIQLTYD